MDRKKAMDRLNGRFIKHFDELYAPEKKRLVLGEGALSARILLVGEAPGEQEALMGRPFVGKAGKVLEGFFEQTGLVREQIYLTNVVKLRPTALSKAGRTVNRAPTSEEIALFAPWLAGEIELVRPEVIVSLGNVALRALTQDKGAVIGGAHGRVYEKAVHDARLFPLYHPAALIYNRSLRELYDQDLAAFAQLFCKK